MKRKIHNTFSLKSHVFNITLGTKLEQEKCVENNLVTQPSDFKVVCRANKNDFLES